MADLIDKQKASEPNLGNNDSICTKTGLNDEDRTTGDCISRKQAIDALDKHIDTFDAIDTNYLSGLRTAMSILKEMPSAQPHWIPCSERLPEEDEDVLVCSEEGDIDIACWMPEQWTDEPHIEWWSGEYRVDAVAWMPLPEPYGGDAK